MTSRPDNIWKVDEKLLAAAALLLMVIPFVGSFNELLTAFVMRIQVYMIIHEVVVPAELRMVAVLLTTLFGIKTNVAGSYLTLETGSQFTRIFISWNCVGWQSLLLFVATVFTGIQGEFSKRRKALTILLGLEGIILVNLARILLVALLGLYLGYTSAVVFHDYAGTVLTVAYLVAFWHFATKHLLPSEQLTEAFIGVEA